MKRSDVLHLRERLLASVALAAAGWSAGCSADTTADPVLVPAGSGSAPAIATAAASEVPLPSKDPAETAWRSPDGVVCMPPDATSGAGAECGSPGPWIHNSSFSCGGCIYRLDASVSAAEAKRKGGPACCYQPQIQYRRGRPFEGPLGALLASGERGGGWSETEREPPLPRRRTSVRTRLAVAEAYRRDALEEHAAVAAFARLSLSLLRLGAPSELLRRTHEAALDEVRHARDAFAIASALAGEELGPGPLPVATARPPCARLVELFEETLRGGCVGEAVSASLALESARSAGDPLTRSVLLAVADDEARHAELAVHVALWAARVASDGERGQMLSLVAGARAADLASADEELEGASPAELAWLGRLTRPRRLAAERSALQQVVLPMLDALGRAVSSLHSA